MSIFDSLDNDYAWESSLIIKDIIKRYIITPKYSALSLDNDKCESLLTINKVGDEMIVDCKNGYKIQLEHKYRELTNGAYKWGKCDTFSCAHATLLNSLQGAPVECDTFVCACTNIRTLEGSPRKCVVYNCSMCDELTDLTGSPDVCTVFICSASQNLQSLNGSPLICKEMNLHGCVNLNSLKGCPANLNKLNLDCCDSIESLDGDIISVDALHCSKSGLRTLNNIPDVVDTFICEECHKLTEIGNAGSKIVKFRNFHIDLYNTRLNDLPDEIKVIRPIRYKVTPTKLNLSTYVNIGDSLLFYKR